MQNVSPTAVPSDLKRREPNPPKLVSLSAGSRVGNDSFFVGLPTWMVGASILASLVTRCAKKGSAEVKSKKEGVKVVDGKEVPWNLYLPKKPLSGRVTEIKTLTDPSGEPNWETCHVTIDTGGKMPFVEGQTIGITPPDDEDGNAVKPRLYSISSSAVGDDGRSNTVSFCVKRLIELNGSYVNREIGMDKPDKSGSYFPDKQVYRGVGSNFMCDLKVGDEVPLSGPTGKEMLLPDDPNANILMLATGTGIAPMRAYCRYLFHDAVNSKKEPVVQTSSTPMIGGSDGRSWSMTSTTSVKTCITRHFKGKAWMFVGVPHTNSLLYHDETAAIAAKYPHQFRYDYAISREQKDAAGRKMYIQTRMAEYADELWDYVLDPATHIYVCGLKGMIGGLKDVFERLALEHGTKWDDVVKQMKKQKRYHVEVY